MFLLVPCSANTCLVVMGAGAQIESMLDEPMMPGTGNESLSESRWDFCAVLLCGKPVKQHASKCSGSPGGQ